MTPTEAAVAVESALELDPRPNTVEFDEASLADASIDGDIQAFETLYNHYFPKVRSFCIRKLGDRELAEDIAQEAFARAFKRIGDFGGPRHFGGWVGTIAANLCTDNLRRRKNTPIPLDQVDNGPSYEEDPIRSIAREDNARLVRLAMAKLEPRHQEALVLHEVKGMSCAAVGRELGISEVAAESLLARARRRLRKEITAKAAPADLFGVGGVGLLPAMYRAWRRARDAASRRLTDVQSAALRGWDAMAVAIAPASDGGRALIVAMGAGLAIGVASAAAPPVVKAPAPSPSSTIQTSGRAVPAPGKPADTKPQPPIRAKVDAENGSATVGGSTRIGVPPAGGTSGKASTELFIDFGAFLRNPEATSGATRVVVTDDSGKVILDTGQLAVGQR